MLTAMNDKLNVTGSFAAELLKQKNIIRLSAGEQVHLLHDNGALSNGRANNVKRINPGDIPNPKKINNCRG